MAFLFLGLPDFLHLVLVRLCDEGILVFELVTFQLTFSLDHLLLSPQVVEAPRRSRSEEAVDVLRLLYVHRRRTIVNIKGIETTHLALL